jgi:hypothetical protein
MACGVTCSTEVAAKTPVALIATPASGSVFAHWSGGGWSGTGTTWEKVITSTRTAKSRLYRGRHPRPGDLLHRHRHRLGEKQSGRDRLQLQLQSLHRPRQKVTLSVRAAPDTLDFSGFSGACTGTKACKVTMSEAHSVTAT